MKKQFHMTGKEIKKAREDGRLNPHLAKCPYCEAQTEDQLLAEYTGEYNGQKTNSTVQAVICPFCGYLDAWTDDIGVV